MIPTERKSGNSVLIESAELAGGSVSRGELRRTPQPFDTPLTSERIRRLYDVAAALSQAVTPQAVAEVTVNQGLAAAGANAGSLVLFSDDGKDLITVGSLGYSTESQARFKRFPADMPIPLCDAARTGEIIYLTSRQERLDRYPALVTVDAVGGTESSVCMPMIIGDRVVGAFGLSFNRTGPITSEDREFLISLTRQCGQALERARLFEAERQARASAEAAEADSRELAEKLQRQSRLFEKIASSTPDFIYVFDLTGRFLYANRRLLEVWGTTYEQAVGKSLYELGYPQWHADMHMREIKQVIETRQPVKGEVPFTGGSGISGWYEYIFTPVLDSSGNVEVIAGTTRDVSERKRAESERHANTQALRESEARFRQLADTMPQIVWSARPDGVVDYYNRRWFEFINQPDGPLTDANAWDQFVHPEDLPRVFGQWTASIKSGNAYRTEFRVRNAKNKYFWFLVRADAVRDDAETIVHWFGTFTDITDRKDAEEQRQHLLETERAARSQAEHASRMKDEFLATLSHELRTPLNAILGWATILSAGSPDDQDLKEGLDTIQRNARAQTQIIEDLLDMSRIISGKVRLVVRRVDLAAVLQESMDTVKPAADAKGVNVLAVIDPQAAQVNGDPNRLQQVFWNLLNNAVKFTPRGGQIRVSLARVDSHIEIAVADSGEGIRPEFLPHVFDRFRQADASITRRHGGLGLGLAIVKQLVELHGGTVRADSPGAGKGTTFTVALPLSVFRSDPPSDTDDHEHPAAPDAAAEKLQPHHRLTGVRVLVVDDEPDARILMKRLLEDCDAVVKLAGSAQEAIKSIETEKPDVLVSDVGMPGEDGYTLIRRVRSLDNAHGGAIPALALTAYARTEDRSRALGAGFQAHVAKPVDPTELIAVIARMSRRRDV